MDLISIKEAAEWASQHNKRNVTTSNISYLINYGCITKHPDNQVDRNELVSYYEKRNKATSQVCEGEGSDLKLSFANLKESETTKHVHRLHPYKGKFIPQLVEHYAKRFFKPGDTVLDPFLGSGTTLVQLAEMGINGVGIDISEFNTIIANVKLKNHDFDDLHDAIESINKKLASFKDGGKRFEELDSKIKKFNNQFFPSPQFKVDLKKGIFNEKEYGKNHETKFREENASILNCEPEHANTYLEKWYTKPIRNEIAFLTNLINEADEGVRQTLMVILSRTVRSCRSTTHNNLTTLNDVVLCPYYCRKHKKICRPIYSLVSWWKRYCLDTCSRLWEFNKLKDKKVNTRIIPGDSSTVDIGCELDGMFSSPPYVGLIDYHEQHAYAYEIFGIPRHDDQEIGSMSKRSSKKAVEDYVTSMTAVFANIRKFMKLNAPMFTVVNDDRNLYPTIFEQAGLEIVEKESRLVSNRTESTKPYYETIFQTMRTT